MVQGWNEFGVLEHQSGISPMVHSPSVCEPCRAEIQRLFVEVCDKDYVDILVRTQDEYIKRGYENRSQQYANEHSDVVYEFIARSRPKGGMTRNSRAKKRISLFYEQVHKAKDVAVAIEQRLAAHVKNATCDGEGSRVVDLRSNTPVTTVGNELHDL